MKGVLQGNVPNDTATGGPNPIQTGATGLGGTVGNTLGNTANTGGNLASNVGQSVGNTTSNLGQTARDFGQTGSLGGLGRDTASTLGQAVGDTGTTGGNLAKNTFGTVGGTFSDTGSAIGANTSGNLGQGLASGFERTGSGIGGVGNLAGGMTSAASNTMGNVMGAPSSLVGTGQTSNLQSNYPSGLPLGETYASGYSSGLPGQTAYSSGYSSGLPTGYTTASYSTPGLTTGNFAQEIRSAPTVLHEKLEKPTIVRETILPQEKIEVQPIIHREREQLEVHEVVQPMHERDIAPTNVRYATLPAQMKADVRESDVNFQSQYRAATTRYVPEVATRDIQREFVNKAPILEEHVSKKIIEEVQPVLYRETVAPTLIEETQPIYEKIVETPTIFEETRQTVELGTKVLSEPFTGVSNVSTGISNLGLREPSVLHKETIITKEIFGDQSQSSNVAPTTQRIV